MKLKHVVAAMAFFGVISGPALADDTTTTTTTTTDTSATPATDASATTSAPVAKKHHHRMKHHHHHASHHEYRDMSAMPVAPMVEAPRIDNSTLIFDSLNQNVGRAKALPDWFNRVGVSGGINADAHWGNLSQGYMGENTNRLSVNDVYLNFSASVNDWVKAFAATSYNNVSDQLTGAPSGPATLAGGSSFLPKPGQYSNVYPVNTFTVEQGYITVANYDVYPVFFQFGKQYTDFGRYVIHPITRTLAQVMSESLQTSAKLGFITQNGFHGDVYAFNNPMTKATNAHATPIYGAALGYDMISDSLGFDLGIGYMSNITGVNDVAAAVGIFNGSSTNGTGTYIHSVGAWSVYADVNSGPFTLGGRYVTASQEFNATDMTNNYLLTSGNASRPWAADLTAGYGFTAWSKSQNVYLGYQASGNAVNIFLPRSRWMVGYGIDVWKNTYAAVEAAHDNDYSANHGGTGNSSNTLAARLAVKFG